MPAKWDDKRRAWPDAKDFHGIEIIPHFDETQKGYYNRKAFQFTAGGQYCHDREDFEDKINTLLNCYLGDNHSYRYLDSIEIRFHHHDERMPEGKWTGGIYMKEGDDETGLEH